MKPLQPTRNKPHGFSTFSTLAATAAKPSSCERSRISSMKFFRPSSFKRSAMLLISLGYDWIKNLRSSKSLSSWRSVKALSLDFVMNSTLKTELSIVVPSAERALVSTTSEKLLGGTPNAPKRHSSTKTLIGGLLFRQDSTIPCGSRSTSTSCSAPSGGPHLPPTHKKMR